MRNQAKIGMDTVEKLRKRPYILLFALFLVFFYVTPLYKSYGVYHGLCENRNCNPFPAVMAWEQDPNFLVYTNSCKIMEMNPFDKSVKKFLKLARPMKCREVLVRIENEHLVIDPHVANNWKYSNPSCCYRTITRLQQDPEKYNKDADWGVQLSAKCFPIPKTKGGIKVDVPYVKVECQNGLRLQAASEFYSILLPPDRHSKKTKEKSKKWKATDKKEQPPSILIVGIDSISRMHMIRSLPKTKDFLVNNDFVEMKGYTKMGENTFPNIMGSMAGMELNKYGTCWKSRSTKVDDCPFIWKNFSSLNYMTAHIEDSPGIAIFNYEKTGFVEQPTDYYLRTLMTAQHKYLGKGKGSPGSGCVAGFSPTNFMLKYLHNFLVKVGSQYPYFLLSWFTSIGHDEFNGLQTADEGFQKILHEAVHNPNFNGNNTVILFISDHGYRFGAFRETFLGFYEESLPFFFIRLPPAMKSKMPHWYTNLKINSQRLTSPLDLHATFQDILSYSSSAIFHTDLNRSQSITVDNISHNETFDNSTIPVTPYSFFEPMPLNRTCENAGIPPMYCMCGVTPLIGKTSKMSSHLGEFVVQFVNSLLKPLIKSNECAQLKFSKFLYGREINKGDVWNNFGQFVSFVDYLVALEATPSKAHFEAKVRIFANKTETILGTVSRINSYRGQSDCIADYTFKNYCYCKDDVKAKKQAEMSKITPIKNKKATKVPSKKL